MNYEKYGDACLSTSLRLHLINEGISDQWILDKRMTKTLVEAVDQFRGQATHWIFEDETDRQECANLVCHILDIKTAPLVGIPEIIRMLDANQDDELRRALGPSAPYFLETYILSG